MGAIHLAKNPTTTPNSKHINTRHHFIRERVANGEVKVIYVPSEDHHADFLTKPLHLRSTLKFCDEYSWILYFLWLSSPILDFSSHGISVLNVKSGGGGGDYDTIQHIAMRTRGEFVFGSDVGHWFRFLMALPSILMTDPRFTCGN